MKNKSKNPNAPKKGDSIKTDPIRNPEDIQTIKKLLENSPRDLLLFVAGINNGLRTGDLLKLKVHQIRSLKVGDSLSIKESKTKKQNVFVVNENIFKAIQKYITQINPDDNDFVFKSRKGKNQPLSIPAVNLMIKKWCKAINLDQGNYGAHSLRKTWGYQMRTKYGVGIELISKRFNHTSPAVTFRYIGIEDKEVHQTLLNNV